MPATPTTASRGGGGARRAAEERLVRTVVVVRPPVPADAVARDQREVELAVDAASGAVTATLDPGAGAGSAARLGAAVYGHGCPRPWADLAPAEVAPLVDAALQGEACCILAYGTTGSGKSHALGCEAGNTRPAPGAVGPYAARRLFAEAARLGLRDLEVHVAMIEVYREAGTKEQVFDLLQGFTKPRVASLSDGAEGLWHAAAAAGDVERALRDGAAARAVDATAANLRSSRSHAVLLVRARHRRAARDGGALVCGRLMLVDLAGSERSHAPGGAAPGAGGGGGAATTSRQGAGINVGLMWLGMVVSDLAEKGSTTHWRGSELTRLLRPALGGGGGGGQALLEGGANCLVIGCLSPMAAAAARSKETLEFLARAGSVKVAVSADVRAAAAVERAELARENAALRAEAAALRAELAARAAAAGGAAGGEPAEPGDVVVLSREEHERLVRAAAAERDRAAALDAALAAAEEERQRADAAWEEERRALAAAAAGGGAGTPAGGGAPAPPAAPPRSSGARRRSAAALAAAVSPALDAAREGGEPLGGAAAAAPLTLDDICLTDASRLDPVLVDALQRLVRARLEPAPADEAAAAAAFAALPPETLVPLLTRRNAEVAALLQSLRTYNQALGAAVSTRDLALDELAGLQHVEAALVQAAGEKVRALERAAAAEMALEKQRGDLAAADAELAAAAAAAAAAGGARPAGAAARRASEAVADGVHRLSLGLASLVDDVLPGRRHSATATPGGAAPLAAGLQSHAVLTPAAGERAASSPPGPSPRGDGGGGDWPVAASPPAADLAALALAAPGAVQVVLGRHKAILDPAAAPPSVTLPRRGRGAPQALPAAEWVAAAGSDGGGDGDGEDGGDGWADRLMLGCVSAKPGRPRASAVSVRQWLLRDTVAPGLCHFCAREPPEASPPAPPHPEGLGQLALCLACRKALDAPSWRVGDEWWDDGGGGERWLKHCVCCAGTAAGTTELLVFCDAAGCDRAFCTGCLWRFTADDVAALVGGGAEGDGEGAPFTCPACRPPPALARLPAAPRSGPARLPPPPGWREGAAAVADAAAAAGAPPAEQAQEPRKRRLLTNSVRSSLGGGDEPDEDLGRRLAAIGRGWGSKVSDSFRARNKHWLGGSQR